MWMMIPEFVAFSVVTLVAIALALLCVEPEGMEDSYNAWLAHRERKRRKQK